MLLHIFAPETISLPPWATHERLAGLRGSDKVLTSCCCCKMPADETVCTIVVPPPIPLGMKRKREVMKWVNSHSAYFYDPEQRIECGPGFGCNANPRRKIGRHLREMMYD